MRSCRKTICQIIAGHRSRRFLHYCLQSNSNLYVSKGECRLSWFGLESGLVCAVSGQHVFCALYCEVNEAELLLHVWRHLLQDFRFIKGERSAESCLGTESVDARL